MCESGCTPTLQVKKTERNHLSSYFELMGLGRLTAYLSGIKEVLFDEMF